MGITLLSMHRTSPPPRTSPTDDIDPTVAAYTLTKGPYTIRISDDGTTVRGSVTARLLTETVVHRSRLPSSTPLARSVMALRLSLICDQMRAAAESGDRKAAA